MSFGKEGYNVIYEMISTEYLKEPQYYKTDAGCEHEYEMVVVEVRPKGKTFAVKTTLFRNAGDIFTKAFQPIWDDKKIQKSLKKLREDEKKGKERKYKPIKYRELTKNDIKSILLAHIIFYKWLKENVKKNYPDLERIVGTINTLDFIYRNEADILNKIYDNDVNTIDGARIDDTIAALTMTKKEYKKYCHGFMDRLKRGLEDREKEEKSILKGLVCHKCSVPMVEFEEVVPFSGKGHYMNTRLDGRKCPKCGFVMYSPRSAESYLGNNNLHYIIFPDGSLPVKNVSKEITDMRKEMINKRKKSDEIFGLVHKREKKVLESIREEHKTGKPSKYFGSINSN